MPTIADHLFDSFLPRKASEMTHEEFVTYIVTKILLPNSAQGQWFEDECKRRKLPTDMVKLYHKMRTKAEANYGMGLHA